MNQTNKERLIALWNEKKMFYKELKKYNLVYDNAKARYGQCRYTRKEISISRHHINGSTFEEVEDTLLHEIAHAIDFSRRGTSNHDYKWKKICLEIGAKPQRVSRKFSINKPKGKYTATCKVCGHKEEFHRMRKGARYSCGVCRPNKFDENFILDIKVNY